MISCRLVSVVSSTKSEYTIDFLSDNNDKSKNVS